MDSKECERLRHRFRPVRRRFFYHRDRYALILLRRAVGEEGMTIRELRSSNYARLLERPLVKELLGSCGSGRLTQDQIDCYWPERPEVYRLSFGWWGDDEDDYSAWDQVSRPGMNFVVRLNFPADHDRQYERIVFDGKDHPFQWDIHPVDKRGVYRTMAWARVDFDLARREALIEEIQSDWVRFAVEDHEFAERAARSLAPRKGVAARKKLGRVGYYRRLDHYVRTALAPHIGMWAEATMSATLEFLVGEMKVQRIFYHTWESGSQLKQIRYRKPPRSLYTDLPKRFCFAQTDEIPDLLRWEEVPAGRRGKKKLMKRKERVLPAGTRFFKLEL